MAAPFRRGEESWSGLARCLLGCVALASACALETSGPVLFERGDAGSDAALCPAGDDSCAAEIELRGDQATAVAGGDSGSPHLDLCPDEQILIGYSGVLREISVTAEDIEVIGSLEGVCGRLSYGAGGVTVLSSAQSLSARGDARGGYGAWTRLCPADHTLVGAVGRAGLALDQLALLCARWEFDSAQRAFVVAREVELPSAGGAGGTEIELRCPAGQIARGHDLRAGRWIDAFGLVCATPTLRP